MARPVGSFRFFDDARASLDSSVAYFGTAQILASGARLVVDAGCGRGALIDSPAGGDVLQDLRGPGRTVVGIDIDLAAGGNPLIDEFRPIVDHTWPLDDGVADVVVSDWVLEHIAEPARFMQELTRVLRPGGAFLARTVSRASILALGSRLVPNSAHVRVLKGLQPGREARDVFDTHYRMNTRREIRELFNPDFTWAVTHRPGLDQYLMPWPPLARAVAAAEPKLPRAMQTVMIIAARRRGAGDIE